VRACWCVYVYVGVEIRTGVCVLVCARWFVFCEYACLFTHQRIVCIFEDRGACACFFFFFFFFFNMSVCECVSMCVF